MKLHLDQLKESGVLLALGSGGARGWAHIGVLRALQKAGISVHGVAGSSMGSLVGAAFASGHLDMLHRVALEMDWKQVVHLFLEFKLPRSGLVDGEKVVRFVQDYVSSGRIEDMPTPFRAVAADLATGNEKVINSGSTLEAVRASISIPGIFTPVRRDGLVLVDGGIANPVPVSVARTLGTQPVLAVDLNYGLIHYRPEGESRHSKPDRHLPSNVTDAGPAEQSAMHRIRQKLTLADPSRLKPWTDQHELPNIFEVLGRANRIREAQLADLLLKQWPADILVRPDIGHLNVMDFHRAEEAIGAGYRSAVAALNEL